MTDLLMLTPHLPNYQNIRGFLKIMDGKSLSLLQAMRRTLDPQRGTNDNTTDWTKPSDWIPERLKGLEQQLATKLWQEGSFNPAPRYLRGTITFIKRHSLWYEGEQIRLTSQGQVFLQGNDNSHIGKIDAKEAFFVLLQYLAEKSAQFGELLVRFSEFCRSQTTSQSDSFIKSLLSYRLRNLRDRNLIEHKNSKYIISELGFAYLQKYLNLPQPQQSQAIPAKRAKILEVSHQLSEEARQKLRMFLSTLAPQNFEKLIGVLLEIMGYKVEVTPYSKDGGIDVIASIDFGVNTLRTAVQVKRYKGNIPPDPIRSLRGVVSRQNFKQGVFITLSGFTKDTHKEFNDDESIVLIDGEKLIQLMGRYGLGIEKRQIEYDDFVPSQLEELFRSDDELEE